MTAGSAMTADSVLVSAAWLYDHLEDPEVAIADCRFSLAEVDLGRQHYQTGHIPGAYFFDLAQDLSSPVQRHGGRHPLPEISQLAAKLAAIGVDSEAPQPKCLVAYDASRFAFAARFWWLLRYMGYPQVMLLDGGWQGWVNGGYPISQDIPASRQGRFQPRIQANWVADIDAVRASQGQPGVALVDARESDRYRGEREPIDPIAGHIPGAVNYPWQDMTDDAGYGRSTAEQVHRWQDLQGANEIIVYCGSGVTACVNLLSLEMAGMTGKLYPGSWSDWCSYLA